MCEHDDDEIDLLRRSNALRQRVLNALIEHFCPDMRHTIYNYEEQAERIMRHTGPLEASDV